MGRHHSHTHTLAHIALPVMFPSTMPPTNSPAAASAQIAHFLRNPGTVEYSALVWAFVFGYLGWHENPAPYVYIGAVLIVAAGAFVAFSERRRGAMLEAP